MKEYKSIAANRAETGALVKTAIIELMECSKLQYCSFQYEQGLKYLEKYVGDEAWRLERSDTFWNWWKNQWLLRDEQLLIGHLENCCLSLRRTVYSDIHDGVHLASDIHPNKYIMERSYAIMMDQFIKQELDKNHPEMTQ